MTGIQWKLIYYVYYNAKHPQNYLTILYHIFSSLTNFTGILCKGAGKRHCASSIKKDLRSHKGVLKEE